MRITLRAWRQAGPDATGAFETYDVPGVSPDMSFLEMLDTVNERLQLDGKEPIAFDHDCREGICGSCGMMINGVPHGPERGTATCQLHMRKFSDGDHVTIEPWRAASFPLVRDLIVDRGAFDRIIEAGGYVTGAGGRRARRQPHPDPEGCRRRRDGRGRVHRLRRVRRRVPERRRAALHRREAAAPQPDAAGPGRARWDRTVEMVETMESYFGSCTNHRECEAACPKSISIDFIALMNRDYAKAQLKQRRLVGQHFHGGGERKEGRGSPACEVGEKGGVRRGGDQWGEERRKSGHC